MRKPEERAAAPSPPHVDATQRSLAFGLVGGREMTSFFFSAFSLSHSLSSFPPRSPLTLLTRLSAGASEVPQLAQQ